MKTSESIDTLKKQRRFICFLLGFLFAFVALNAFGGGFYAMSGAKDVPVELLEGSPFNSFFIPGLILFVVVGGSLLFASIAVFARFSFDRVAAFSAIGILFVWLGVQVAVIGYMSWMQPATGAIGLVMLGLSFFLPKRI
jgi:hypothetical protein